MQWPSVISAFGDVLHHRDPNGRSAMEVRLLRPRVRCPIVKAVCRRSCGSKWPACDQLSAFSLKRDDQPELLAERRPACHRLFSGLWVDLLINHGIEAMLCLSGAGYPTVRLPYQRRAPASVKNVSRLCRADQRRPLRGARLSVHGEWQILVPESSHHAPLSFVSLPDGGIVPRFTRQCILVCQLLTAACRSRPVCSHFG